MNEAVEAAATEAKIVVQKTKPPIQPQPYWRELSTNDIQSLAQIADKIHPSLPESDEVFAERVQLFPKGCLGLVDEGKEGNNEQLCGYVISHPIRRRQPPALNCLLGKIASDNDDDDADQDQDQYQYYIHDLAILPKLRGRGLARECITKLLSGIAKRYPTTCLISVYGTEGFWSQFGFVPVRIDDDFVLEKKLLDYGDDAVYLEREE